VKEDTHEIMSWQTTSKFIYDDDNDEEEDNIMIFNNNYAQQNDMIHLQSYHHNMSNIHGQEIFRKRHKSSSDWMFNTIVIIGVLSIFAMELMIPHFSNLDHQTGPRFHYIVSTSKTNSRRDNGSKIRRHRQILESREVVTYTKANEYPLKFTPMTISEKKYWAQDPLLYTPDSIIREKKGRQPRVFNIHQHMEEDANIKIQDTQSDEEYDNEESILVGETEDDCVPAKEWQTSKLAIHYTNWTLSSNHILNYLQLRVIGEMLGKLTTRVRGMVLAQQAAKKL